MFEVELTRTVTFTQTITVDANDEFEAADKAMEQQPCDYETWNVSGDSWETDLVTEMGE
jgi:hypothetical protein